MEIASEAYRFDSLSPTTGPAGAVSVHMRRWYALFTVPRNEKSVGRHLQVREIEHFLPTFETMRIWKNRQRVKVMLPLFPSYLFVRIEPEERVRVLQCPGALHIVGNRYGPLPLPDPEIDFLRSDFCRTRAEPYRDLVIGQRVRICNGLMRGLEGTLIRKNQSLRFVLTLALINQQASIEVNAEDLEPLHA